EHVAEHGEEAARDDPRPHRGHRVGAEGPASVLPFEALDLARVRELHETSLVGDGRDGHAGFQSDASRTARSPRRVSRRAGTSAPSGIDPRSTLGPGGAGSVSTEPPRQTKWMIRFELGRRTSVKSSLGNVPAREADSNRGRRRKRSSPSPTSRKKA